MTEREKQIQRSNARMTVVDGGRPVDQDARTRWARANKSPSAASAGNDGPPSGPAGARRAA